MACVQLTPFEEYQTSFKGGRPSNPAITHIFPFTTEPVAGLYAIEVWYARAPKAAERVLRNQFPPATEEELLPGDVGLDEHPAKLTKRKPTPAIPAKNRFISTPNKGQ